MVSLDRGLFGRGDSGDVVSRHLKYAQGCGHLDVIVFAAEKYEEKTYGESLSVIPTKSAKFGHYKNARAIARKLLNENRYDLIVTQEFAAPVGAKLKKEFGLPWIVSVHSMFFSAQWLGPNPFNWLMLFLLKRAMRRADGFRVNNSIIRERLIKWNMHQPILVQPTAIDIEKFRRTQKRQNLQLNVLYVGRLSPEKNIPMLIHAFKSVQTDSELWIVGAGLEAARLQKLAANDRRIKFLGPKKFEELPQIFQSADIFVLPSNTESFGQVLLQAAAAGCAIIATATTGARGILGDGESGVMVPVKNEKALAVELGSLLANRYEREYWAKQAEEMSRRYDSPSAVKNLIEFWKKVAGK